MVAKTSGKKDTDKTVEPKEEVKDKFKYYYSPSASHMLAGFIPEARYASGAFKNSDVAIEFKDHWIITGDAKVQRFLENTKPFKDGYIELRNKSGYEKFESRRSRRMLGQNVVNAATSQNYESDQEYIASKKLFEDSE